MAGLGDQVPEMGFGLGQAARDANGERTLFGLGLRLRLDNFKAVGDELFDQRAPSRNVRLDALRNAGQACGLGQLDQLARQPIVNRIELAGDGSLDQKDALFAEAEDAE